MSNNLKASDNYNIKYLKIVKLIELWVASYLQIIEYLFNYYQEKSILAKVVTLNIL
jgi:hypothetical protein